MATIIYAVLPDRLKRYDFSYPYEYASPTFCMTKPMLSPQFLSLYYPLANEVWLSILLALVLVPVVLFKVCVCVCVWTVSLPFLDTLCDVMVTSSSSCIYESVIINVTLLVLRTLMKGNPGLSA